MPRILYSWRIETDNTDQAAIATSILVCNGTLYVYVMKKGYSSGASNRNTATDKSLPWSQIDATMKLSPHEETSVSARDYYVRLAATDWKLKFRSTLL